MRRTTKNKQKFLTPCVGICKLENDICIGCKRTDEEISNWFWYTDDEKLHIMEKLKFR